MSTKICVPRESRSFLQRGLAAAFVVTLVAACGGGSDSSADDGAPNGATDEVTSITVGVPPSPSGGIIPYAESLGLFEKYNLKVETTQQNGGAESVPALEGGAIQIAQSNVLSVIQGARQGLDVPCFAGTFTFGDEDRYNYLTLIAGGGSGVTSAKDLAGKTVAVNATGGVNQLAADAYLESEGVDYTKVKYVAVPFPSMPQAVASGQVDAAVTPDPFASQMLGGGGKLLDNNVAASVKGSPIFACWNASSEWVEENPEVASNFVKAMDEAAAAAAADFGSFRDFLKTGLGVPPAIADNLGVLEFTTEMDEEDVAQWQDAATKFGILEGDDIDPSAAYTPVKGRVRAGPCSEERQALSADLGAVSAQTLMPALQLRPGATRQRVWVIHRRPRAGPQPARGRSACMNYESLSLAPGLT